MIKLPKPIRDEIVDTAVEAFKRALDQVIESTAAESDGGRKITRAERKLIGRAAWSAVVEATRKHTEEPA